MFPPSVPKLRINGDAIVAAADDSNGIVFRMSSDSTMSVSVVVAPMVIPDPEDLMPFISGIVVTSTSAEGNGKPLPCTQSFIIPPTRSLPPPRTLAPGPSCPNSPTAWETVVGSCRSKPFIRGPPFLRHVSQGREDPGSGERNVLHPHANRVVNSVDDRRRRRRDGRLANPVRAEYAVVLRLLDHHYINRRYILDRQHLVVEQVRIERHTSGLVAHERFGQRLADAHDRAALDLLLESHRVD